MLMHAESLTKALMGHLQRDCAVSAQDVPCVDMQSNAALRMWTVMVSDAH